MGIASALSVGYARGTPLHHLYASAAGRKATPKRTSSESAPSVWQSSGIGSPKGWMYGRDRGSHKCY